MTVLQNKYKLHPLENEYTKRGIQLRPYQEVGVKTMLSWFRNYNGGINADEMGLGKTCQTIVTLTTLFQQGHGPFLVVAPYTTLQHWVKEIKFFSCDQLKPFLLIGREGEQREEFIAGIKNIGRDGVVVIACNVSIMTSKFLNVWKIFRHDERKFTHVVVDEAHCLKNVTSHIFKDFYERREHHKMILLTGTPIQNYIEETFALLLFVDLTRKKSEIHSFVEKHSTEQGLEELGALLKKVMIRRLKEDVCQLPDINEIVVYHGLSELQKKLYKELIEASRVKKQGYNTLLMQMRKLLLHPYLFKGVEPEPYTEGEHLIQASGKFMILSDILRYLKKKGHKVLIFSQFRMILDVLEDFLDFRGYSHKRLDGNILAETRQTVIDEFQSGDGFVLMMTTKTGGYGITLTAANTVIFLDSDYNPHNDLQAMARTHRIGQTKIVRVIRLLARDTADSHTQHLAKQKMELFKTLTGEELKKEYGFDLSKQEVDKMEKAVFKNDKEIEQLIGSSVKGNWLPLKVEDIEKSGLCIDVEKEALDEKYNDYFMFEGENHRTFVDERRMRETLGIVPVLPFRNRNDNPVHITE